MIRKSIIIGFLSLSRSEIELHYTDFGQTSVYKTYFSNGIFENPKIILNADSNHYYEKLD